jgi:hypothetical protein
VPAGVCVAECSEGLRTCPRQFGGTPLTVPLLFVQEKAHTFLPSPGCYSIQLGVGASPRLFLSRLRFPTQTLPSTVLHSRLPSSDHPSDLLDTRPDTSDPPSFPCPLAGPLFYVPTATLSRSHFHARLGLLLDWTTLGNVAHCVQLLQRKSCLPIGMPVRTHPNLVIIIDEPFHRTLCSRQHRSTTRADLTTPSLPPWQ